MFSKPQQGSFFKALVEEQRSRLQANLHALGAPADEQEKIMELRGQLPDQYHKMPLTAPSGCFWLLENKEPPERTWGNQRSIDAFKQCRRELHETALGLVVESTGMKPR